MDGIDDSACPNPVSLLQFSTSDFHSDGRLKASCLLTSASFFIGGCNDTKISRCDKSPRCDIYWDIKQNKKKDKDLIKGADGI